MKQERTYQRDLTWSLWHRHWAGVHIGERAAAELDVADVDWQEYCGRSQGQYDNACWQTICLLETTSAWDSDKTAAATLSTARMADLPMAIIWYRKTGAPGQIAAFRVRVLWPERRPDVILSPPQMAEWLLSIHRAHRRLCGGPYADSGVGRIRRFPPFPAQELVA